MKCGRRRSAVGRGLVALGVLMAATVIGSGWFSYTHRWHSGLTLSELRVDHGVIAVVRREWGDPFGGIPLLGVFFRPENELRMLDGPWRCCWTLAPYEPSGELPLAGLIGWSARPPSYVETTTFAMVLWPTPLATLSAGALLLWSARRAARAARGFCSACGYDLRGLAAGAACPECGKAKERATDL